MQWWIKDYKEVVDCAELHDRGQHTSKEPGIKSEDRFLRETLIFK